MPLVTPQPRSEIGQMRTKSDVRVNPISGRLRSNTALTSQRILALNKEADDQRRKSKYAHSATEYHYQPNGPASVVLDNLKGYIREVPPRHKTSKKAIEVDLSSASERALCPAYGLGQDTADYRSVSHTCSTKKSSVSAGDLQHVCDRCGRVRQINLGTQKTCRIAMIAITETDDEDL